MHGTQADAITLVQCYCTGIQHARTTASGAEDAVGTQQPDCVTNSGPTPNLTQILNICFGQERTATRGQR